MEPQALAGTFKIKRLNFGNGRNYKRLEFGNLRANLI